MQVQNFIDKMKNIQNSFLNYIDDGQQDKIEENYENIIQLFADHKFCEDKHELKEIIYIITYISNYHFRSDNFFEKITKIILIFAKDMQKFFSNIEIFNFFQLNKRILLFLIEEKILIVDKSIADLIISEKFKKANYLNYFKNELKPFVDVDALEKQQANNQNLYYGGINMPLNINNQIDPPPFNPAMAQPQFNLMMNRGVNLPYMNQPYMNQGLNQPYMNQGLNQPYMNQGLNLPYMNQGLNQPYMNQGANQPYVNQYFYNQQPAYFNQGMFQPYNNQGLINQQMNQIGNQMNQATAQNNQANQLNLQSNQKTNEINEQATNEKNEQKSNEKKTDEQLDKNDADTFEEKRKIGENDNRICELIRKDMIDDFISYVNQNNTPLSSPIPSSIFETNPLLLTFEKKHSKDYFKSYREYRKFEAPTLIEYAAFFGSFQIFKYLYLNKASVSSKLWDWAIHSQNSELIKYLEENKIDLYDPFGKSKSNNVIYEKCLKNSLKYFHIDVSNYIIKNFLQINEGKTNEVLLKCYKYHNYAFIEKNDINQSLFDILCKYDYYSLIDAIIKEGNININKLAIII